jgi:serine/threonine protein kinase
VTDDGGYYLPVVGTIIGERYKVVEKRGRGAFGIVFEVEDIHDTTKTYAIKILRKMEMT